MNKVLVLGDACTDIFVYGDCTRLCPDVPAPVFVPKETLKNGGMAANVTANLKHLGINSHLICNSESAEKTRFIDQQTNYMFLRIDSGEDKIQRIVGLTEELLSEYEIVVISDYNKGFLAEEDISFICKNHPIVFMDTKKILGPWAKHAKFIKINEKEFNRTKHSVSHPSNLIITLGNRGCEFQGERFPVQKVEVKDMSGAGDTFLAGLVCKYLETEDIRKAIVFANECATKVVQRRGVGVV
tara:strand:- start:37 stop:762 length:726 start_codon:yes stop_codon:yes gene_type:complete